MSLNCVIYVANGKKKRKGELGGRGVSTAALRTCRMQAFFQIKEYSFRAFWKMQ